MNSRMKVVAFATCILLLSLLPLASQAFDIEEDTGSLMLNDIDFHSALAQNDYLLVNFHALWCRYSKKLKPEWKKLSDTLKNKNSQVKLAKVEAYDEKKLAEEYGIDGFPNIKLFIKQQPYDYTGERLESHLLEFINRKLKNDLTEVTNKDDIQAKLKEYEWVGVLVGNNNVDAVKDVAFDNQDVLFVRAAAGVVGGDGADGQFILYNNITSAHDTLTTSITKDSLTQFLNSHRFPNVAKFSKGTAEKIFLSEDPAMILIRSGDAKDDAAEKAFSDAKNRAELKDLFMSVANTKDEISQLLAKNLGVNVNTGLPAVVIVRADRERIRKYKLNGAITADSILGFYNDYKARKAQRLYLSEEAPVEDKDLVKKVVTNTFQSLVLDKTKDVLLLIWAPWCGHCRAMMPVYDNVARKTREVSNFLVAKIDASVNDLEGFGLDIVEYPTILFFTRNDKENPIEFKGERNEYVFNDFIRSHAAVDLARMKGPNPFDKNEL